MATQTEILGRQLEESYINSRARNELPTRVALTQQSRNTISQLKASDGGFGFGYYTKGKVYNPNTEEKPQSGGYSVITDNIIKGENLNEMGLDLEQVKKPEVQAAMREQGFIGIELGEDKFYLFNETIPDFDDKVVPEADSENRFSKPTVQLTNISGEEVEVNAGGSNGKLIKKSRGNWQLQGIDSEKTKFKDPRQAAKYLEEKNKNNPLLKKLGVV